MMSNSDFEKLWFRYKPEGEPNQISINEFCIKQGIEYTKFYAWFKRTKKQVVSVKIEGLPTIDAESLEFFPSTAPIKKHTGTPKGNIMVMIQTRGGLKINQTNLDYQGLKDLVGNLEGLC